MLGAGLDHAHLFLNAAPLTALKRAAKDDPNASLKDIARQFESLVLGMLMKNLRAGTGNSLFDSDASRLYTDMLDQAFAEKIAAGRGLGLADMLVRQLSQAQAKSLTPAVRPTEPVPLKRAGDPKGHSQGLPGAAHTPIPLPQTPAAKPVPLSPKEFVQRMRPYAETAARELGVPAAGVLAQAALESGWGRRELRHPDGRPTHNLFGIKAGDGWHGETMTATTTEYVDGVPQPRQERFRAYGSYEEAFRDYAALLKRAPRYRRVLEAGDAFASRLQASGYATDPHYAAKLNRVMAAAERLA